MLQQGISLSGESKGYFIDGRIEHLRSQLGFEGARSVSSVLDFACGVGDASTRLAAAFGGASVLGVDIAEGAVEEARRQVERRAGRVRIARCHVRSIRLRPLLRQRRVPPHTSRAAPRGHEDAYSTLLRPAAFWLCSRTTHGVLLRGLSCGESHSTVTRRCSVRLIGASAPPRRRVRHVDPAHLSVLLSPRRGEVATCRAVAAACPRWCSVPRARSPPVTRNAGDRARLRSGPD